MAQSEIGVGMESGEVVENVGGREGFEPGLPRCECDWAPK